MTTGYIGVPVEIPGGKKLATTVVTVGADDVHREQVQLSGSVAAGIIEPTNADPATTVYALPVRPAGALPPVIQTGTLNGVDQTVELATQGRPFAGAALTGGLTFSGLLTFECYNASVNIWEERYFHNGDNWVAVESLPHPNEDTRIYSFPTQASDTHVRLRVLSYTSGSVSVVVSASTIENTVVHAMQGFETIPTTMNAVDAAVEIPTWLGSAGFSIAAGTLAGTLVVESHPLSHGTTGWVNRAFFSGAQWYTTGLALTNPNAAGTISVPLSSSDQRIRLRISIYSSGSLVAYGRSSLIVDPIAALLQAGVNGQPAPPFSTSVAGLDGSTHRVIGAKTATPAVADVGAVTREARAAPTGTRTQIPDNGADVLILNANAARIGATVFNDSSATLYISLGTAAASTTDYTARVATMTRYDVPAWFTGQIRGIWGTDPNDGAARVTELT